MTVFARLALGFIGAAVPVLAMAAPPSVTNVTAVNEDGRVRVIWTQLPGDISAYHIFYSHQSILGNNGLYDDFESVDGSVNTHVLQSVPPVDELYVAMLAVDANGDESPYFLEEARVELRRGSSSRSSVSSSLVASSSSRSSALSSLFSAASSSFFSSSSSSLSSTQQPASDVLRLLNAQAISATGILLSFSQPVHIPQDRAMDAIKIEAGSGRMLSMRRYILQGNTVIVHTEPQQRDTAYRVTVGDMVTGLAGNQTILLAADQTPVLFTGHPTGIAPSSHPSTQTVQDVTQLKLRGQPDGQGTYTVEVAWQAPGGMITGYSVAQTTDGGNTYGEPRTVGNNVTAVSVPRVPAGQFGVLVKAIGADGSQSHGIAQMLNLPTLTSNPLPGSVSNGGKGELPNSGPALWLAVTGIGSMAGAWQLRRRKQLAA